MRLSAAGVELQSTKPTGFSRWSFSCGSPAGRDCARLSGKAAVKIHDGQCRKAGIDDFI